MALFYPPMPPSWLDLHEGESIQMKTHPSHWLMFKEFLYVVLASVVVGAVIFSGIVEGIQVPAVDVPLEQAILVVIPLAAIPLVVDWVERRYTVYVITDDQVWKKSGVISREIDPLQLDNIVDIEIHQGVLDRFLGIGEVAIANAGTGEYDMQMENVPSPNKVAAEVRRAMDGGSKLDEISE